MTNFKPTFGIDPTDDYDKARKDLMQAAISVRKLSAQQQQQLATELFGAANVAALLRLFRQGPMR